MDQPFELDVALGEKLTLRVGLEERACSQTTFQLGAAAKLSITAGTIWIYDADEEVIGAVDTGTTGAVTDASFDDGADAYRYMTLQFTSGTQLNDLQWMVTSFNSGVFTLETTAVSLPVAPPVGTTFRLDGNPIIVPTAMTVSNGVAYYSVTPASGVTSKPGRKIAKVLLNATTTAGDAVTVAAMYILNVH